MIKDHPLGFVCLHHVTSGGVQTIVMEAGCSVNICAMTVRHLKIFQVIFISVLIAHNQENMYTLNSLSRETGMK